MNYYNQVLFIAILSWLIAQVLKFITEFLRTRKINFRLILSAGGMPSSHSAFVASMSTAIGLREGFDSSLFAVCVVLSLIVMYDAAGVRRAAGNHAAVINDILEIIENQGIKIDAHLKELLGHSPIEVFGGAILGIILAIIIF